MIWNTIRTARKVHRCSPCGRPIRPGERYLSGTISPNDNDIGNIGWWTLAECEDCAIKYGRMEPREPVHQEAG